MSQDTTESKSSPSGLTSFRFFTASFTEWADYGVKFRLIVGKFIHAIFADINGCHFLYFEQQFVELVMKSQSFGLTKLLSQSCQSLLVGCRINIR